MFYHRYADPIDYVLNQLKNDEKVTKFDILNAVDQWERTKNPSPIAWARMSPKGKLYDLRLQNNPYYDPNIVVELYVKN